MKLTITYDYLQAYLPNNRCKNPRHRRMVTTADVTVSEVKMDDFPVAFIVHDYGTRNKKFQKVSEPIRTYGGKLYTRWRVASGSHMGDVLDISDLYDEIKRSSGYEYKQYVEERFRFNEESKVVWDNSQSHVEIMQDRANEFVIDDKGGVWKETGEPMYHILTFGLGHNHGGTGFFIDTHYNSNCSAENYFTALQYEEARDYFNKVALGRGDTESVDTRKDTYIEVIMPEMVKRNPEADHANGGDPFVDALEDLCNKSESVGEAALLTTAYTMASISAS